MCRKVIVSFSRQKILKSLLLFIVICIIIGVKLNFTLQHQLPSQKGRHKHAETSFIPRETTPLPDRHLFVYDITSRNSFSNLQKWIEEVRRYTASNVMLIIVGNKSDLDDEREVEFDEAQQMCQYIAEVLFVMETSAKKNHNVDEAFVTLVSGLKRRLDTSVTQGDDDDNDAIKLGQSKPLKRCSSSCNLT